MPKQTTGISNGYKSFLYAKMQIGGLSGFDPIWMPDSLFDFQKHLVEWSIKKGRGAIFADCGLGKTICQLAWAENVVRKTNRPVLIATPLAVSNQTIEEGVKFDIECIRSKDGKIDKPAIYVTNYERLHYFDCNDFSGMVCDESSILKNFNGSTRHSITEFMRRMEYRLLCTATASPNDYIELGTSSEALGDLGYMDMLSQFFKNDENSLNPMDRKSQWRFKYHAEKLFWRWVCSWARSCRKPSDIGFSDEGYELPPLKEVETIVEASRPRGGFLFALPARGLHEQRDERRHTITERCESAAEKVVNHNGPSVSWCHLNDESSTLEKLIPDAKQITGSMPDDLKEERFEAFQSGQLKNLVIKPKIGGFGLNWQHCSHMTMFPSHSFEQYYQSIRRCWRFGQKNEVVVDIITTEGEAEVLSNLRRKAGQADEMFSHLVAEMKNELSVGRNQTNFNEETSVPAWL